MNIIFSRLLLTAGFGLMTLQPCAAQTIQDSVKKAIETHPVVERKLAEKFFNEQALAEVRSGLFPVVTTNLSAGRIFADNSTSRGLTVDRGAAYSYMGEGSASLIQPLFDGRETKNRMEAAKARIDSGAYDLLDNKERLALAAAQAHLAILQSQDVLQTTKSYYDLIADYKNRIRLMVDEGVADEVELAQADNILLQLQSTISDYTGQVQTALANYHEIVGTMPTDTLQKPLIDSDMVDESLESLLQKAKASHPLVLAGEERLRAIQAEEQAEKSGFLPTLDGEISYLQKDQREVIGGELTDARAVLKMNWDLETGGAQKAREQKKKAEYSEALAQNREDIRALESQIRQAFIEFETAQKQYALSAERVDVTQQLLTATENQFEGARVRLLQLMQAENQLFTARLEHILAEYRMIRGQFSVMASEGALIEKIDRIAVAPSLSTQDRAEDVTGTNNISLYEETVSNADTNEAGMDTLFSTAISK